MARNQTVLAAEATGERLAGLKLLQVIGTVLAVMTGTAALVGIFMKALAKTYRHIDLPADPDDWETWGRVFGALVGGVAVVGIMLLS